MVFTTLMKGAYHVRLIEAVSELIIVKVRRLVDIEAGVDLNGLISLYELVLVTCPLIQFHHLPLFPHNVNTILTHRRLGKSVVKQPLKLYI